MRKLGGTFFVLTASVLFCCAAVNAQTPIVLAPSASGTVVFTSSEGDGNVWIDFNNLVVTSGTTTYGIIDNGAADLHVGGIITYGAFETLTYSDQASGYSFTGPIEFAYFTEFGQQAQLVANLYTFQVQLNLVIENQASVSDLFTAPGTVYAHISTGTFLVQPAPEPGTLTLLVAGILAMGVLVRRASL